MHHAHKHRCLQAGTHWPGIPVLCRFGSTEWYRALFPTGSGLFWAKYSASGQPALSAITLLCSTDSRQCCLCASGHTLRDANHTLVGTCIWLGLRSRHQTHARPHFEGDRLSNMPTGACRCSGDSACALGVLHML